MPKIFVRLVSIALLLLATQLTRFENRLTISFDGAQLSAEHFGRTLTLPFQGNSIQGASIRTRATVFGAGGVSRVAVSHEGGTSEQRWRALWLWGRAWLGSLMRGDAPRVPASFNDWTDFHLFAEETTLAAELPAAFRMEIDVVGRGESRIALSTNRGPVIISVNDGFIDNAFGICLAEGCPEVIEVIEPIPVNVLRVANTVCELMLGAVLLLSVLGCFGVSMPERSLVVRPARTFALAGIAVLHFGACLYFGSEVLGGVPHISDSAVYYRQGILLSKGMLISDPLPTQPFEAFRSNASRIVDDRLLHEHANHFWPALIAVFLLLGVPFLLGPLLSLGGMLSLYGIVRRISCANQALMAATLYAMSPFVIISAGEFMMHTCTMSLLLMALLAWMRGNETGRSSWFAVAGGLCAYAFCVRQLTVMGLSVALVPLACSRWREVLRWRVAGVFALGALPMAVLFGLDSLYITGSFFRSPHAHLWGLSVTPANFKFGLSQMESVLAALLPIAFYSPAIVVFGILVCFGLLLRPDRWCLIAAALIAGLFGAYTMLNTNGMHGYGPRFMTECLPAAFFLAARGLVAVLTSGHRSVRAMAAVGTVALFAVDVWGMVRILPLYRHYNGINTDLYRQLAALPPDQSLVLVNGGSWQDMDIAATLYDPTFTGLIVVHQLPGDAHQPILDHFRGRRIYRAVGFNLLPDGVAN
jgi:hypothetical protein